MTTIASATPIKATLTDITTCIGWSACQIALLSSALLATCSVMRAQTVDSAAETQQLRSLVSAQQKALEQQQAQMPTLQRQLTGQQQTIISIVERNSGTPQYLPAVDRCLDLRAGDYNLQAAPQNLPASAQAPEDRRLEQDRFRQLPVKASQN